jgi:hypothetical protein
MPSPYANYVVDEYVEPEYSDDSINTGRVMSITRAGLEPGGQIECFFYNYHLTATGIHPSRVEGLRNELRLLARWTSPTRVDRPSSGYIHPRFRGF